MRSPSMCRSSPSRPRHSSTPSPLQFFPRGAETKNSRRAAKLRPNIRSKRCPRWDSVPSVILPTARNPLLPRFHADGPSWSRWASSFSGRQPSPHRESPGNASGNVRQRGVAWDFGIIVWPAIPSAREFDFEGMLIQSVAQDWRKPCLCTPAHLPVRRSARPSSAFVIPSMDLVVVSQGLGRLHEADFSGAPGLRRE